MLATNQSLQKRVLTLDIARSESSSADSVEWSKFFDTSSKYKLLYTL